MYLFVILAAKVSNFSEPASRIALYSLYNKKKPMKISFFLKLHPIFTLPNP